MRLNPVMIPAPLQVHQQRHRLADLLEDPGSDIARELMNPSRGHGSHVLALPRKAPRAGCPHRGRSGSRCCSMRIVRVKGTTWTTLGPPLRMRAAATTTAGRRSPASLPAGLPRSSSTTSPGVSIEPRGLNIGQLCREVPCHGVLTKRADGVAHRLVDCFVAFGRQARHPRMGVSADADRRCLGQGNAVVRRQTVYRLHWSVASAPCLQVPRRRSTRSWPNQRIATEEDACEASRRRRTGRVTTPNGRVCATSGCSCRRGADRHPDRRPPPPRRLGRPDHPYST